SDGASGAAVAREIAQAIHKSGSATVLRSAIAASGVTSRVCSTARVKTSPTPQHNPVRTAKTYGSIASAQLGQERVGVGPERLGALGAAESDHLSAPDHAVLRADRAARHGADGVLRRELVGALACAAGQRPIARE